MIRNLKVLGLALGALFALSAVTASAASAVDTFTPSQSPAVVTGENSGHTFEITGVPFRVTCGVARFSGTVTTGASQITAFATYYNTTPDTKCPATVGTATVIMNGCDYDLTGNTSGSDGGTDATVSITCPVGKAIEIRGALGCIISVPAQTPTSGGVTYTNETVATKKVVTVHATVTGITYTANNECVALGISTHGNDAIYTGTVTVKGFEDTCVPASTCPFGTPEKDEFDEGSQINIEYTTS